MVDMISALHKAGFSIKTIAGTAIGNTFHTVSAKELYKYPIKIFLI